MPKPNIVFIFSDQQRPDTMGYAGDPVAITPNLDRLASQGMVFSQCATSSPVCMPARASMMTGYQVHQHGVWAFADPELRHGQSHVRNIRDVGYRTGVVGKTHLWPHGDGHASSHVEEMQDWGFVDAREVTGPSESLNTDSSYTDHLAAKGFLNTHRQYFEMYLKGERPFPWELPPTQLPAEDHLDRYIAELAQQWLGDCPTEQPFYLQVNFGGPHDPWDAPNEYRSLYNADDIPLSMNEPRSGPLSPHVQLLLEHAPNRLHNMSAAQNRVMKSNYYSKVTLIDDCVGRIVNKLEQLNILDNTWIVFSSDHGEMLGDHGLLAKKVFYDGAVTVPCLFRPPQNEKSDASSEPASSQAKSMNSSLTCHLDVVATLVDICGAAPLQDSDGRSVLPQLRGEQTGPHRSAVLAELGLPPSAFMMVRTDQHKLCVDAINRQPIEQYDLGADPNELHNLIDNPAYAKLRGELINDVLAPMLSTLDTSLW